MNKLCPLCSKKLKNQSDAINESQEFVCIRNKDGHSFIVIFNEKEDVIKYKVTLRNDQETLKLLVDIVTATTQVWSGSLKRITIPTIFNLRNDMSITELSNMIKLFLVFA